MGMEYQVNKLELGACWSPGFDVGLGDQSNNELHKLHKLGPWKWQGEDYIFQKHSNLGVSGCMWGGSIIENEDPSYIYDETTPVRDCGDFDYHADSCEYTKKAPVGSNGTSPQVKRRRMLQFGDKELDRLFQSEDSLTSFLKSKESLDTTDDLLHNVSEWESGFQEDISLDGFESLDRADSWLADCLNDTDIFGSSEQNSAGSSDGQNDHTEDSSTQSSSRVIVVQLCGVRATQSIVLKGEKPYIKTSGKLASSSPSSVMYPFTFIKPFGADGNVTLSDINQKILSPLPEVKQCKEDPYKRFPISAFSGKPVVGKTKIHTEGGKGSITIRRTKG